MKKYNKINKEQVLQLFDEKKVINRKDITTKYKCSVYSAVKEIDTLKDDGLIRLSKYGYIKIGTV